MTSRLRALFFVIAVALLCANRAVSEDEAPSAPPPEAPAAASDAAKPVAELQWVDTIAAGKRRSLAEKRPILIRAGAPWCPWCTRLKEQMQDPVARTALAQFVLVDLNVDNEADEAQRLSVGPIPALRLLDARGRVVASHDGYLAADALATWIAQNRDKASAAPDEILTSIDAPSGEDIAKLITLAAQNDPIVREAALRRLATHPAVTAATVSDAFRNGRLATRLATLEVLAAWHAPIDELDPWRPETLSTERLAALDTWARDRRDEPPAAAQPLSTAESEEAARELARLSAADDAEVEALRERLSRHGAALVAMVDQRLASATSDRDRERLLALRYRLFAAPALVVSWPAGFERLSSSNLKTRHDAAAELADRATTADQPLLLELFKDADPLVREISLRGLQKAGGAKSSGSLASLLNDPEPNVRAAVLKQLAEQPASGLLPVVIKYIEQEKDPDLVIHGIRVLKAASGSEATKCLIVLLEHESWQVRADAAEAVGELARSNHSDSSSADAYAALIALLDDPDSFVVSRALMALQHGQDLAAVVEPLARVVDKHPELAVVAVEALVQNDNNRQRALPHLRRYAKHENPAVRAAVIPGLIDVDSEPAETYILAGLDDPATIVRQAAARALMKMFDAARAASGHGTHEAHEVHEYRPKGFFATIGSLIFGGGLAPPPPQATAEPVDETAAAAADQPVGAEAWLAAYRAGKDRPEWMNKAVEPLQKMLAADDPQERLWAGLALVPLGHETESLPVLKELARTSPTLQGEIGLALTWLPRNVRRELFGYLTSLNPHAEEVKGISEGIAQAGDTESAELLWNLLGMPDLAEESVTSVHESLWKLFGGEQIWTHGDESKTPLAPELLVEMKRYAAEGKSWQRTIALALLLGFDAGAAAEASQAVLDDEKASEDLQSDALQVLLLALPAEEGGEAAVKQLTSDNQRRRKLAFEYLCFGADSLSMLRGHLLYLRRTNAVSVHYSGEPQSVTAPKGVTVKTVRPLLDDPDPEIAAGAAYLLATLGEPEGLPKLIAFWRGKGAGRWGAPLYRAIAATDAAEHVGVLSEIYSGLKSYEMRQFYWTIRSMHGDEILKLRKRIREEVGMDNLR